MSTRDPDDRIDDEIVAPLQRADVSLDELHRARLGAAIEAGLDAVAARATRAPEIARRRRRVGAVAGAVAVVVTAAIAAVVVLGVRSSPGRGTAPPGVTPGLMTPYLYSGPGAHATTLLPSSRLVVPAGARTRAAIGTRVRLTLVGPGVLAVVDAVPAGEIDLVLEQGALFVDYDGSGGGTLKVRSPGAVTSVVGTLFSVEAAGGRSRVAVARGHVRIETGGRTVPLERGTAWDPIAGAVTTVPAELASALGEHDASSPPPVGEFGLVRVGGADDGASAPGELTLDGRPLASPPLVARIPAGSHLVGQGDQAVAVAVARGANLRLDAPAGASAQHPRTLPELPARLPSSANRPSLHAGARATLVGSERPAPRQEEAPTGDAAPAPDIESLYAGAENDMRTGHRDRARRTLQEIAARESIGGRAEAALLDLARLALADNDPTAAREYLARLDGRARDPALAEPADHLRCTTELHLGDVDVARACLSAFRRRYPRSLHDAEALSLLATNAGDCSSARPLLEEYLQRYPHDAFAADARARLTACR